MVNYIKGDLLDSDCDYICHQVNCRGVMGAGIARQIREKWPWVYGSYTGHCKRGEHNPTNLLGNIWGVAVNTNEHERWVINMFSQATFDFGESRYTSYDAFAKCLTGMRDAFPRDKIIGFPKGIGCGLGGGDWKIISAMIESILGETHTVRIYELEE